MKITDHPHGYCAEMTSEDTGANPKIDSTRAELERTAKVQQDAQDHYDRLVARYAAATEAVRKAKQARKTAKAELTRSEKAVKAEQATAKSLGEQVKPARKLVTSTHADVEAAERRHNIMLTKQAKRQEKDAAAAATREAEQTRARARRTRQQTLRDAEERARTEEREARDQAERRAGEQVRTAEKQAERSRRNATEQAAALAAGGDASPPTDARARPARTSPAKARSTRGSTRSSSGTRPRRTG